VINTQLVFQRLDLGTSRFASVQKVRAVVAESNNPQQKAEELIFQILGLKATYDTTDHARLVAQAVVDEAWKVNHAIDNEQELLTVCEARIVKYMGDPNNACHFVKPAPDYRAVATVSKQVTTLIETKVEVKKNGSMKKGGAQLLARELYTNFVLNCKPEDALDNQGFIRLLVKELNMSKEGATTYAYNCKKVLGQPAGGMKQSKKGRKAK